MTNRPKTSNEIESMQSSSDFVVLNNPLSNPKFIRAISKSDTKTLSVRDVYTRKLFFEIASRLKPEDLQDIKTTESITIEIQVKQFAEEIGATNNNNFYTDLKNTAEYLRSLSIPFIGNDGLQTTVGIVTKVKTDEKGKMILFIDGELAQKILEINERGNFSFLKKYIFGLQNGQAIRLYPFLKSWLNNGKYSTNLERFKNDFGYNTVGYNRFNKLEKYVLTPAIGEINEKTDLLVSYEVTGENLESKKPRVNGLIFTIKSKTKQIKAIEQGQTKPQEPKPQRDKSQITQLSTLYTIFTSLKFDPMARLPRETAEATIMQWVNKYGYNAVYNGLTQAKDTYKSEIKNPIGFFSGDYFINHKNYINQKEQSKQEQQQAKQEQGQQTKKLNIILNDFAKKEFDYFTRLYDQQTEAVQQYHLEDIKKNPVYFDFENRTLTRLGTIFVGREIAKTTGYDASKTLVNFAKRDYATQILFSKDGKPFIHDGLFDQEPQEQTIEAPQLTTPSITAIPTSNVSEVVEPKPSENLAETQEVILETESDKDKPVETPSKISTLFKKYLKI